MKIMMYKCDFCGKEFDSNAPRGVLRMTYHVDYARYVYGDPVDEEIHLCGSCSEDMSKKLQSHNIAKWSK